MLLHLASSLISSVVVCSDLYSASFSGVCAARGRKECCNNIHGRYCWFLHPQPLRTKHNFSGEKREKIMQVVKHACTDQSSEMSDRSHDFVVREETEPHSKVWCARMCAFYRGLNDCHAVPSTCCFGRYLYSCTWPEWDHHLAAGQFYIRHGKATSFDLVRKQTLAIPQTCVTSVDGKLRSGQYLLKRIVRTLGREAQMTSYNLM